MFTFFFPPEKKDFCCPLFSAFVAGFVACKQQLRQLQ